MADRRERGASLSGREAISASSSGAGPLGYPPGILCRCVIRVGRDGGFVAWSKYLSQCPRGIAENKFYELRRVVLNRREAGSRKQEAGSRKQVVYGRKGEDLKRRKAERRKEMEKVVTTESLRLSKS